jgi:endonuclease IV
MNLILGIHTSKKSPITGKTSKDISEAIIRDTTELHLNASQIFTYGPRFLAPNKIDNSAVLEVSKDIDLTVHSAYMTTGIWKVSTENASENTSKKKLDLFKAQMLSCKKIGAWGMVLHVSKQYPDILTDTMTLLKPIAKKLGVKVVLEMVASKADPDRTYETPEKIDNLTTLIGPKEPWWGWCIDTAHIWCAGVDIRTYSSMKKWLDALTFKKRILMFHLNGASSLRGSGVDKHAIAFGPDDRIWNGIEPEKSGVRAVVEFAIKYNITIICEINRGLEDDTRMSLDAIVKLAEQVK